MTHANYLRDVFVNRKATINKAVRRLRHLKSRGKVQFDAIAFTGLSGSLIAPSVADRLGVGLVVVRKRNSIHSYRQVESTYDPSISSYVIIDDLVCDGTTIRRILKLVKKWVGDIECNGLYLYSPTSMPSPLTIVETEKEVKLKILNTRWRLPT